MKKFFLVIWVFLEYKCYIGLAPYQQKKSNEILEIVGWYDVELKFWVTKSVFDYHEFKWLQMLEHMKLLQC